MDKVRNLFQELTYTYCMMLSRVLLTRWTIHITYNSKLQLISILLSHLYVYYVSCEAIVEVCLGCIVYAAKSVDETTIDHIDINLLVTIMQKYEEESTIQEQACLAIESMASSSTILKKKLLPPYCYTLKGELIAAKDRITNERNKKYPGLAAVALGIELWYG